jgi:DNA (cytosine-5)-methyltransferase 1
MTAFKGATLGSLFDGSGTCPLAATLCGIEPVWASEIEPYPVAVTTKRFPSMLHLGDITKINGAAVEPVDIITFGSPCQDLSVAGKRAGLEGGRSSLFHEAVRIIREMREETANVYPKYVMWENVPGAFSSNKGLDFRAVLEEIAEADIPMPENGKWATAGMVELPERQIAWRTLDAQYWGVPQRRRRIFLVCDFTGQSAGEILFKPESLPGDFEAGGETGQGTTGDAERSAGEASGYGETGIGYWQSGIQTLRAEGENRPSRPGNLVVYPESTTECLTPWDNQGKRIYSPDGVAPTLSGSDGGGGRNPAGLVFPQNTVGSLIARADGSPCIDRGQPFVMTAGFMGGQGAKAGGIGWQEETAPTLKAAQSGSNMVPSVVAIPIHDKATRYKGGGDTRSNDGSSNGLGIGKEGDPAPTLDTGGRHAVFDARGNGNGETVNTLTGDHGNRVTDYTALTFSRQRQGEYAENNVASTQQARQYKDATDLVDTGKAVRRLTPTECARLQGFPDWWCADVPGSDSAQYKMWGNGMALPCVLYVMRNMAEELRGGK